MCKEFFIDKFCRVPAPADISTVPRSLPLRLHKFRQSFRYTTDPQYPFPIRQRKAVCILAVGIPFQHPVQVTDIPGIHTNDIVIFPVITPCDLSRAVRNKRNTHFFQFSHGSVMRRIPDLLRTGCGRIYVKLILQSAFFHHVSENTLAHSRTAYIAVAHEKHSSLILKSS